jgi:hypothetical protein
MTAQKKFQRAFHVGLLTRGTQNNILDEYLDKSQGILECWAKCNKLAPPSFAAAASLIFESPRERNRISDA